MLEFGAITGVVTGVMQVAKKWIPKEYRPIAAACLGVLVTAGYATTLDGANIPNAIFIGLFAGMSGSGLFDNGKALKKMAEKLSI